MQSSSSNDSLLKTIQSDINVTRALINSRKDCPYKETFSKFEAIYLKMLEEFNHNDLNNQDLRILSENLSRSVKRLKRDIENNLKINKTDVESCFEKMKLEKRPLVYPLEKEFRLLGLAKSKEFDFETMIDYNFPILECTNRELAHYAFRIIENVKLKEDLKPYHTVLMNLIETISKNYNVVPYHNFSHAFSVFQMLSYCYFKSEFKDFLTPFDIFAGMIASLSHDLNHKGVNNLYKIKKKSSKSIIFSEVSVLESMHCSKFFHIIQDPNLDILDMFKEKAQKQLFKKLLISSILATDMAKHAKLLDKFTKRVNITLKARSDPKFVAEHGSIVEDFIYSDKRVDDRRNVLRLAVHACDIGNPCYKFEGYMNWCHLLSQEFHEQTLKEARNGLEVTEMFKFKDMKVFYNGQVFFSKTFVLPLWKQFSLFFPSLICMPNSISENLRILEEKKNQA